MSVISSSGNLQKKICKQENLRKLDNYLLRFMLAFLAATALILVQLTLLLFRQLSQVWKRLEILKCQMIHSLVSIREGPYQKVN